MILVIKVTNDEDDDNDDDDDDDLRKDVICFMYTIMLLK